MDGKIICIDINAGLILEAKRRILRRRYPSYWDHILRGLDDEEEHDDSSTS